MKQKNLILIVLLFTGIYTLKSQIVNTQFGQIQGSLNGSIYQFLGIPFAKPPVETLRWKAPESPEKWKDVLQTTSFAPICPQKKFQQGDTNFTFKGNEDCLYLNVWTPQTGKGDRAVMVFIHGGGNQQGGASETNGGTQMFFGKNLSERGDVVVVTIQYRLGPLGFLVHPGLETESINGISGNYAVLDQILALKWVKNNISAFGGDSSKVMIFGESAGGVNVGNLLISPLATGLFQRACIQSAAPLINSYIDSKNKSIAFVDSFINSGTDVEKIAFMRSLPADSLTKTEKSPIEGGFVSQSNWKPVADNYVFTDFPYVVVQSGNYNKVPLMIGSNSEEMSLSAPKTVVPSFVTALIDKTVPTAYQAQAHLLYPSGSNATQARESYVGILTDAQFTTPVRRTAQCVSLNQDEPVWRYFFTHKHTIAQLAALGSYHGMELFYVFNNWENATLGKGILFKSQDDSVQKVMLQYWVNFAKTGNPNSSGLPYWQQYQSSNDCFMEIKATPDSKQCGVRKEKSDLWDAVVGFIPCSSSVKVYEQSKNKHFGISPNPATDNITLSSLPNNPFFITIYDFTGNNVYSEKNIKNIDISNFSKGMYLLIITDNQNINSLKFIKQ